MDKLHRDKELTVRQPVQNERNSNCEGAEQIVRSDSCEGTEHTEQIVRSGSCEDTGQL